MRVMLADDSALFRAGLDRLLREAGFDVAGHAGDASQLKELVERDPPEVVVLDIRLPPDYQDEGLKVAREIRQGWPQVGLLLLSQYAEPAYSGDVIALGVRSVGYLLKDRVADIEDLASAVRRVGSGGSVVDAAVIGMLMAAPRRDEALAALTARERAVLALMAEGCSNEAICVRLNLGSKTVETYVTRVFSKLGLEPSRFEHRRVMAVLKYLRTGVHGSLNHG